jgi:chromosome segregation ATPase
MKSMTRWFTWEQINFNSAVHQALSETLKALAGYAQDLTGYAQELVKQEHDLARLRSELLQEADTRREKFDRSERALATLRAVFENQAAEAGQREARLEARCAAIEAHTAALDARENERENEREREMTEITSARIELASQLSQSIAELRDSNDQLREEQRVCFKQLSLEASEAAVMVDRARRVFETRLDKLEKEILRPLQKPDSSG